MILVLDRPYIFLVGIIQIVLDCQNFGFSRVYEPDSQLRQDVVLCVVS